MDQPTAVTQPPKYHEFKDEDISDADCIILKIRVDSDEGQAYAKLSTDTERLQYMRLHAHEKSMPLVSPQWRFYQDDKEWKRYLIRIGSPEDAEVTMLIGDSDEELVDGSQRDVEVFRYFKKHAHVVEVIEPRDRKGGQ